MALPIDEALRYDPLTGVFTWCISPNGRVQIGQTAGRPDQKGYIEIQFSGVRYKAHRLAWFFCHGQWPQGEVDHADGDKANNRINNLRDASSTQNHANTRIRSTNTSGFKGVSYYRITGRWRAQIQTGGKVFYLGYFATKEEAHEAYAAAARKAFGDFARV